MEPTTELVVNFAFGLFAIVFGWLLKTLWGAVTDLQESDKTLTEKVNSIEVLIAGDYVKRTEFQTAIDRLFQKLDSIEAKIDQKADK